MPVRLSSPPRLEGTIRPPGDKSISHRALLLNALARGRARVSGLSPGEDVRATLRCLQALGVPIEGEDASLLVHGTGGDLREPEEVLDAGNSGTTLRLLAGVVAPHPFLTVLTGDRSLRSRPMGRIIEPLRLMGAQVWGRGGDAYPPLVVRGGPLVGIDYRLPVASAQVKSCLLLAGLFARGETLLTEPAPTRDHTERLLQRMGADLRRDGPSLLLRPGPLQAVDIAVPGDFSAAAFWLVAGSCHPNALLRLRGVGINPTRTGLLDALRQMGADITLEAPHEEAGEPVADITVRPAPLQAIEVGGRDIPRLIDEVPVLAVAACLARGTTVIRDAGELRVKESDRIATTVRELSRLGARIEERPDGMVIQGPVRLRGGRVRAHGDHRLAMALAVAGLLAEGETVIEGAQWARVSYPSFWEDLEALAGPSLRRDGD